MIPSPTNTGGPTRPPEASEQDGYPAVKRSLTFQLLKVALSSYLLIAVGLTALQMGLEWRNSLQFLKENLHSIGESARDGLGHALWDLDFDKVTSISQGLLKLPQVTGLEIRDIQRTITFGVKGSVETTSDLTHVDIHGRDHRVGGLTLYSNHDVLLPKLAVSFSVILINALVKAAFLVGIMLAVGHYLISKPLRGLVNICRTVDLDNLEGYQGKVQSQAKRKNELTFLENSFGAMLDKLHASRRELERTNAHITNLNQELRESNAKLDDYSRQLERKVAERTAELTHVNQELERLSRTDALTGLLNRRVMEESLATEWRRMRRLERPLSILMIDIDHFKAYNDHYGHPAGDTCIAAVAEVLRDHARRPLDVAARYGGEEFILIMAETDGAEALRVAEHLRETVAALALEHGVSPTADHVTISLGLATAIPNDEDGWPDLIKAADRALYDSKQAGRDRIMARI